MKTSLVIGCFAAWQPVGQAAQMIVALIQDLKITGAAAQATADAAMLHMIIFQEAHFG